MRGRFVVHMKQPRWKRVVPNKRGSKFRPNCWGHDRSLIPSEESQKNRDSFIIPGLRFAKRANLRGAEATNKRSPRKKKRDDEILGKWIVVGREPRKRVGFRDAPSLYTCRSRERARGLAEGRKKRLILMRGGRCSGSFADSGQLSRSISTRHKNIPRKWTLHRKVLFSLVTRKCFTSFRLFEAAPAATSQPQCRAMPNNKRSAASRRRRGRCTRSSVFTGRVCEGEKMDVAGRQALIAVRLVLIVSKFSRFKKWIFETRAGAWVPSRRLPIVAMKNRWQRVTDGSPSKLRPCKTLERSEIIKLP